MTVVDMDVADWDRIMVPYVTVCATAAKVTLVRAVWTVTMMVLVHTASVSKGTLKLVTDATLTLILDYK